MTRSNTRSRLLRRVGLVALVFAAACAPSDAPDAAEMEMQRQLGPVDGPETPGAAPDRVAVGDLAPGFALESYRGDTLALTDYRGTHEIILVFYRGSW